MRLLRLEDDDTLSLEEFSKPNIPPYAVFSLVWSPHDDEITFTDLTSGEAKRKPGYSRITECARRARLADVEYIWIDPCCIDRSNSVELSDAINSMFEWFAKAARVNVFLADVSVKSKSMVAQRSTWLRSFRHSRWFNRGWILQELLAPSSVWFWSEEWTQLGDKKGLSKELSGITGIPVEALQGHALFQYGADQRISWLSTRKTRREEDLAYCLLGVFGVHMPISYGEGAIKAFVRLQEEVLKATGDLSVLYWYWDCSVPNGWQSIFAPFPRLFNRRAVTPPSMLCRDDSRWKKAFEAKAQISRQYKEWAISIGLSFDDNGQGGVGTTFDLSHGKGKPKRDSDQAQSADSEDDDSDVTTIFLGDEQSASSRSTAGLSSNQVFGVSEVARTLLSQEDLKFLYTIAIHNVGYPKARAHIKGFLKEFGQHLQKEARIIGPHVQAAKFLQELAGKVADEISRNIAGSEEVNQQLEAGTTEVDLEGWQTILQPHICAEDRSEADTPAVYIEHIFDDDSDEELDRNLKFPFVYGFKGFLTNSRAFRAHVMSMKSWLKVEGIRRDNTEEELSEGLGNLNVDAIVKRTPTNFSPFRHDQEQSETQNEMRSIEVRNASTQSTPQRRGRIRELLLSVLDFWGISFYVYDIVQIFVPPIEPGYRRLRWRCSCNTVLWGDFLVEDDHDFEQLKNELSKCASHPLQQIPTDVTQVSVPGSAHIPALISGQSPLAAGTGHPISFTRQNTSLSGSTQSVNSNIVNISILPKYFEVCVNVGNHAIKHHEIDISRVTSDSELFELVWDKYNSSQEFWLRRIFLRPKDVHFVMFSVSRLSQYGAGIHRKPNEFPPHKEIEKKRYHYLLPKTRMPVNVFLHYLHRARWHQWGEHTECIWLRRLPKKLNDSVLSQLKHDNLHRDLMDIEDPNLAFGWGIHIIDGPNHAVLGLILAIGVAVAFIVSGLVVGFAKTQEQGFGVGSFLLVILASGMAAVYFQFQDQ